MVFDTVKEAKAYRYENGLSYTHSVGQIAAGNKIKWALYRKG